MHIYNTKRKRARPAFHTLMSAHHNCTTKSSLSGVEMIIVLNWHSICYVCDRLNRDKRSSDGCNSSGSEWICHLPSLCTRYCTSTYCKAMSTLQKFRFLVINKICYVILCRVVWSLQHQPEAKSCCLFRIIRLSSLFIFRFRGIFSVCCQCGLVLAPKVLGKVKVFLLWTPGCK